MRTVSCHSVIPWAKSLIPIVGEKSSGVTVEGFGCLDFFYLDNFDELESGVF